MGFVLFPSVGGLPADRVVRRTGWAYFIICILNGYDGISPLLTLIAFRIGKMRAISPIAINTRIPIPNRKISGIAIME